MNAHPATMDLLSFLDAFAAHSSAGLEEKRRREEQLSKAARKAGRRVRACPPLHPEDIMRYAKDRVGPLASRARGVGMERDGVIRAGKILVAVGPSPNSRYLVHWAHRTASALGWEWMALHVDPSHGISREDSERLVDNLNLARALGAEVLVLEAPDIAEAVVQTAKARKATMLVIGRSGLSRLGYLPRRPTVSDRIVRAADPIDVAVVQDVVSPTPGAARSIATAFLKSSWREYLLLAASFVAITGFGLLLRDLIGHRSIALIYLAAVLGLSFLARPASVAIFAVLSAFALNFFLMVPRYTLRITANEDLVLFVTYFLVAFVTSSLVARLRRKERMLSEREQRNAFLLASTKKLAECHSIEEAGKAAVAIVRQFFSADAFFLIPRSGRLAVLSHEGWRGGLDEATMGAASCALAEKRISGYGTTHAAGAPFRCIPAAVGESPAGVIALAPPEGKAWRISDDGLLLSLGRNLALIVERERSDEMMRSATLAIESERLSKILLDSVSHELRTPLTTITGSISALRDERLAGRAETRNILVDGALEASDRLNRIVEDILSMSRIESGALRLCKSSVDLADLANESIASAGANLDRSRVRLRLPRECDPVRIDLGLTSRLAANLLGNASRYSPPGSKIEFDLSEEGDSLVIRVRDRGPGVREEELETIFERFKRGREARGNGLGLGLAICRGVAAAHGGKISARNAPGGGLELKAIFPSCVERFAE